MQFTGMSHLTFLFLISCTFVCFCTCIYGVGCLHLILLAHKARGMLWLVFHCPTKFPSLVSEQNQSKDHSSRYHHVNRTLVVETCCERKINVKSFVKLQFCREGVREPEGTRLDLANTFCINLRYLNKVYNVRISSLIYYCFGKTKFHAFPHCGQF